jgi:glycerophosphoryl diester phosphodiesterase
MAAIFDLQGHRGALGLRPENTLPSFEAAFDHGVTSVETDLHLTRDGVVVLCHDPLLDSRLFTPAPPPGTMIVSLTLQELRGFRASRNPDHLRFPNQDASVTPVAAAFAAQRGIDPYNMPTLTELFQFADAYAGQDGWRAGKTDAQRERARTVRFDLELKRVPFFPQTLNDGFDGRTPGLLERRVAEAVRAAGVAGRTSVRSFDHRSVLLLRDLEPGVTGSVLLQGTAPVAPAELARLAGAEVLCPRYEFVDEELVRQARADGVRVVPWTVNEPAHARRLLDWGVDGLTTDYPDRLADCLRAWGVAF